MSYLVDALRKAERERSLGRVPDLTGVVAPDGDNGGGWRGHPLIVLVAVLLVVNIAVLSYFLLRAGNPGPAATPVARTAAAKAEAPGGRRIVQPPSPAVAEKTPAPEPPTARGPEPAPPAASTPAQPTKARQPPADEPETAPSQADTTPAPLSDADVPSYRALAPAQRQKLPRLVVNGLLYSTAPGRSFVLIGGHRYHEGEQIAAGGAVESIDADGIVINNDGLRYRLPAPR